MPEYLAPGVYVEETSFRSKSIEGVGTSTTAFVGPTRKGPFRANANAQEVPELLTSYNDFERLYGGTGDLDLTGNVDRTNYLAHAVLAYFTEGGSRLYVSRVVSATAARATAPATAPATPAATAVTFNARTPGSAGNGRIVLREIESPVSLATMLSAPAGSLLRTGAGPAHHIKVGTGWRPAANPADPEADVAALAAATPRIVTVLLSASDADGSELGWEGLGLHPSHPRYIGNVLSAAPARRSDHLQHAFSIAIGGNVTPIGLRDGLFLGGAANAQGQMERRLTLSGGTDGAVASAAEYRLALEEIAALEDVSIVAAPGSSATADAQAINNLLIAHAESRRAYRIAVLDTAPSQLPGQVRTMRGLMDSRHAALYYPWVVVANPNARPGRDDIPREIAMPPSGYVCGIYARNDIQRGVHKAPANEVVRSALRFQLDVNFGQQEMLNPLGINCMRLMSGRGFRVWGARLISSDPEWKYVSDRRYFNYLESSIDRGTQWAVFEPNGEALWANVRQTISDFLYNEWRGGALLGTSPEQAFFVHCDRSTMTQNDLDNGRLICLIGVAIVKPAEFVIFRIGQKTADQTS